MREQMRNEKERRKAQRRILRADRRSKRSEARIAAKEAYPDSRIVLVYNGRPIAVREVEKPVQVVRTHPRQVMRLPDAPYRGCGSVPNGPCMAYTGTPMGGHIVVRDPDCFGGRCEADVGLATGSPMRKKSGAASKKTSTKKTSKGTPSKASTKKSSTKKIPSGKPAQRRCGSRR